MNMKKKKLTLEDILYRIGLIVLVSGSIVIPLYFCIIRKRFEMPPCAYSAYLHIYCPGCGGTRAVEALLHGHILESVWCHPIVLYTVVVFGGFMLTQSLERLGVRRIHGWSFHDWYLYGAVVILLCNFLLKNLLRWTLGIYI